jgi:hypothetical protein
MRPKILRPEPHRRDLAPTGPAGLLGAASAGGIEPGGRDHAADPTASPAWALAGSRAQSPRSHWGWQLLLGRNHSDGHENGIVEVGRGERAAGLHQDAAPASGAYGARPPPRGGLARH